MRTLSLIALVATAFVCVPLSSEAGAIKYKNTPGDMSWPGGRVPYVFNSDITSAQKLVFFRCVRAWQRFGNVRFVPTTESGFHQSPDGNYLLVQRNDLQFFDVVKDVNYAWIGRSGNIGFPNALMQPMSIHNWEGEVVVHEMGHTLGFIHEHMREDRNTYVRVDYDQINGFTRINFDTERATLHSTYDYDSIMHYPATAFRDSWKTGLCMEALVDPSKTGTMGYSSHFKPHPEEWKVGDEIGKITSLLSDGDRETIYDEYGNSTEVRGVIKTPDGKPLRGVTATLVAVGSGHDEQAFVNLLGETGERQIRTNSKGEFFFRGVPSGSFKIQLFKSKFTFSPTESTFQGGSAPILVHLFDATHTDSTPPNPSFTVPPQAPPDAVGYEPATYKAYPTLSGEAHDTGGSGLNRIQLAMDNGGRWWNWSTHSYGAPGAAFNEATDALPHTTFDSAGKWTLPASQLNDLPDGTHHLQIRAGDLSNNYSPWEEANFTVDRNLPVVTADAPPAAEFFDFETLNLGGTITDATDPNPTVTITFIKSAGSKYWDGKSWIDSAADPKTLRPAEVSGGRWKPAAVDTLPRRSDLSPGNYLVLVKAKDKAGNFNLLPTGIEGLERSIVDPSVPDVAITPSFHGQRYAVHEMPTLIGTANDAQSYVKGVRVYLMRLVPGMNGAPNGFRYWTGFEWSPVSPNTPPHLEVTYNPTTHVWSAPPTREWGDPATDVRLPTGAAELPDGTYKVQATAFNREEPQGTRLVEETFYTATAPPQVTITSPTHNGFAKAGWTIGGTVSDPSGTGYDNGRMSFTLVNTGTGKFWNGDEWQDNMVALEVNITNNTWSYDGSGAHAQLPTGEGQYAISATVTDRNGNISRPISGSNQILFRADLTPPTCEIAGPTNNAIITTSPILSSSFHGTASDASGQPQVTLFLRRLKDNYFWSGPGTGNGWKSDAEDAILTSAYAGGAESEAWALQTEFPCLNQFHWGMPNGAYVLTAVAKDAAGNTTQRDVNLTVNYNPPWLRPQDALARFNVHQTAPVAGSTVTSDLTHSFTPWLDGQPGNGGYLTPRSFDRDAAGNFYVTNNMSQRQIFGANEYWVDHGVIQRVGPNGWRRQRMVEQVIVGSDVFYYERWSPGGPSIPITAGEYSVLSTTLVKGCTDAAGNTYAAFELTDYSPFGSPKFPSRSYVLVVKFDAQGNLVWRRFVPGLIPPSDWLAIVHVHDLLVAADGTVSLVMGNNTRFNESFSQYHAWLVRLSATGTTLGTARMGQTGVSGNPALPYKSSSPEHCAVAADGTTWILSTDGMAGVSYPSQILRKYGPDASLLASFETNLCKAPERWTDLAVDTNGIAYVTANFQVSENDGRACLLRFDSSLNLTWRAFGPQGGVYIGDGLESATTDYRMHVGAQGITVMHETPGTQESGYYYRHPAVLRFTDAGELNWARRVMPTELQGNAGASHLQVTSAGDVLLTGFFSLSPSLATSYYGKISNAGDLQYLADLAGSSGVALTCLTANDRLAVLEAAPGSVYFPQGDQSIRIYGNPASVLLPVVLDAGLPQSRSVLSGSTVEFKVVNRGSAANYQWRKQTGAGTPQDINGATGDVLILSNVQSGDAGGYSCVVTNDAGSVTSGTATLTVVQVVPLVTALDDNGRTWTTGGDASWYGATGGVSHDGTDAAVSGEVDHNQVSWMETTVTGPATISFWWKSSTEHFDALTLKVDGVTSGAPLAGDRDWTLVTRTLGSGTHTLRWEYERDGVGGSGLNRVWVDQFSVVYPLTLTEAVDAPAMTFTTGGDAEWAGVASTSSSDFVDHAASAYISSNKESWMETTVTGPGTLTFWWDVESDEGQHYLRLKVDGSTVRSISGFPGWAKVTQAIGAGTHTIRWAFESGPGFIFLGDGGKLDRVSFAAGGLEPGFLAHPASQIRLAGGQVSFSVTPSGDTPQYQWLKGPAKTVLNGTTSQGFTKIHLSAADATLYWVKLTNDHGTATSNPAYLGVATPLPAATTLKEGAALALNAAVAVPPGCSISSYQWRNGSQILTDGTVNGVTTTGAGTKALKITGLKAANSGPYTCIVEMTTPGGTVTGSLGVSTVNVLPKPEVAALLPRTYTVSESVDVQISSTNSPTKYAVTGLPSGVTVNATTGRITGKPRTASALLKDGSRKPFKLSITATNAAGTSSPVTVEWIVNPLDTHVAGTYNGLLDRNAVVNGTTPTATTGLGGTVLLQITSGGVISGTLKLGSQVAYRLAGAVDVSPTDGSVSCSLPITRKAPWGNVTLNLSFDLASGGIAGSVTDGGANAPLVKGWRTTSLTAYNGLHNSALFVDTGLSGDSMTTPKGDGFAALNVTGKGTAKWTAKLPDGSAVAGSVPVGPAGQVMLHQLLQGGAGSVQGWVEIDAATHEVDGAPSLSWFKAPQAVSRSYKDGVALQNLTVTGGLYVAKNVSLHALLGLGAPPLNAQARLSQGGLDTVLSQSFTLTAPNTVSIPTNPLAMKLTLAPATGLVTGSFTQPGLTAKTPRKADVFGLIVPRLSRGAGYFLLPELPTPGTTTTATAPIWSGKLEVGVPVEP